MLCIFKPQFKKLTKISLNFNLPYHYKFQKRLHTLEVPTSYSLASLALKIHPELPIISYGENLLRCKKIVFKKKLKFSIFRGISFAYLE